MTTGRRRIGVLLLVVGAALSAISTWQLTAGDDGGDGERAAGAAATTSTRTPGASAITTAAPTTSTTAAPVETVEAFFAAFGEAVRTGDSDYLFGRLHAAVLERYTPDACRAYVGSLRFPTFAVRVVSVGATGPWTWESDGRSAPVAGATTARITTAQDGTTFRESDAHVAVVDGAVRWFTDCGQPRT